MLWEKQKEYRTAALNAKKQGDLEQARLYLMASKVCPSMCSAITHTLGGCLWECFQMDTNSQ